MIPLPIGPTPAGQGVRVLANVAANQNIWPRGSWGASPPASRPMPASLKRHKNGQLLALDREAMHKASLWPWSLPAPVNGPGRSRLAEQRPPHPTTTHGNAQLPHLAKGEAPLELVVPFKGKGKLPGSGAKEESMRGERGREPAAPLLVPASGRRGGCPSPRFTQPAPALQGPACLTHPGSCRTGLQCPCYPPGRLWTRNCSLRGMGHGTW